MYAQMDLKLIHQIANVFVIRVALKILMHIHTKYMIFSFFSVISPFCFDEHGCGFLVKAFAVHLRPNCENCGQEWKINKAADIHTSRQTHRSCLSIRQINHRLVKLNISDRCRFHNDSIKGSGASLSDHLVYFLEPLPPTYSGLKEMRCVSSFALVC